MGKDFVEKKSEKVLVSLCYFPLGPNRLSQRDFAHIYFVNMFYMP